MSSNIQPNKKMLRQILHNLAEAKPDMFLDGMTAIRSLVNFGDDVNTILDHVEELCQTGQEELGILITRNIHIR